MNKVLAKLYIPQMELEYDVWITFNRRIYTVINLIVKGINELTDGEYKPTRMPILYDKKSAMPYDINFTVGETNIRNGTEIILI